MKKVLIMLFILLFTNTLFAHGHDQHVLDCDSKLTSHVCVQSIQTSDQQHQSQGFGEHHQDCHCSHSRSGCYQSLSVVSKYGFFETINFKTLRFIQKQSFIHPPPYIDSIFKPPRVLS